MFYVVKENSKVLMLKYVDNVKVESSAQVLDLPDIFRESCFIGYENCSCCKKITAHFTFFQNNNGHEYRMIADKCDVVECPDDMFIVNNSISSL